MQFVTRRKMIWINESYKVMVSQMALEVKNEGWYEKVELQQKMEALKLLSRTGGRLANINKL